MDVNHSPAPWSVIVRNDDTGLSVEDPDGGFVADCDTGYFDDEGDYRQPDVSIANARLIAASPDLLEALRDILRIVKAVQLSHGVPGHRKRIERAEAAIAKATGAQP